MTAGQDSWPIRLQGVCDYLGIEIVRKSSVAPGKAYLTWDREKENAPTVLLPRRNLSVWDRFCIAHELGHFFLISRYDWLPGDTSGYWQTEGLCDQFARRLLMPDRLLDTIPIGSAEDGRGAMDVSHLLSRQALVPWIHSGKMISERQPNLLFMRVKNDEGGLKVSTSSLPRDRGRHTKISPLSEFGRIVTESLSAAHANRAPVLRDVERNAFNGTKLGTLFSDLRVSQVFLLASSRYEQIKIAALLNRNPSKAKQP